MDKNKIIGAVVIVVVVAAAGWYLLSVHSSGNATVATVNGTPITRSQLTASESQLASQQGLSATSTAAQAEFQSDALNLLIGQTLIEQAAQQAGITASSSEVDTQVASAKAQFSTPAAYEQALAAQGITETDLRTQISNNLVINAYLQKQLSLSSTTATNAEIQAAYTQVAAQQQPGATPLQPLAQVRSQVEQMVVQQKEQNIVNAYVAQLRAAANVQILIATSTPE